MLGNRRLRGPLSKGLSLFTVLGDVRLHDPLRSATRLNRIKADQVAEAIDRTRRTVEASRPDGTLTAAFIALYRLAGFLILDGQIEPGRAAAL